MRWFTADLHFGHSNIIRYCNRPFTSNSHSNGELTTTPDVDHMNTAVCEALNKHVGPDDELWVLGDVAMGNVDSTIPMVGRLRAGKVFLVPGNHDKCHPMRKRHEFWRGRYEDAGFHVTEPFLRLTLTDGTDVSVSHFPPTGESTPGRADRFLSWRPVNDQGWLLCGHVHDTYQQAGKVINVGIDAWGGEPVSEQTLMGRIAEGAAQRPVQQWAFKRGN